VELQPGFSPVDLFERGLIHGGSRWIADLTEFFRNYRVDDTSFALYAKGKTRSSGFLLSRFMAWTILPNYAVGLFCANEADSPLTSERLRKLMGAVTKVSEHEEFHWAWLIVFSDKNIGSGLVSFVSRYDKKELGLAIASTSSRQIVLSDNQVGKAIGKQLGLSKALEGR
jgi:hypothetical protein